MENKQQVSYVRFAPLTLRSQHSNSDDYSLLTWGARGAFPRITVFLENNNKKDVGNNGIDYNNIITATFDYVTIFMFLKMLEEIIDAEPNTKKQMDCLNTKFVDNQRTNEVYVQATITVGKDKNGIIFIGIYNDKSPKVKFDLTYGKWHVRKDNGVAIQDEAKLSRDYAKAYLVTADKLITYQMRKTAVADKKVEIKRVAVNNNYTSANKAETQKPSAKESTVEEDLGDLIDI